MKHNSDIFICKLGKNDYWAYPSPFVAHGGGFEIQFRNLTDDAVDIHLGNAPVHKQDLSLGPRQSDYVIVNGDATPGFYTYAAEVTPSRQRVSVRAARRGARRRKPGTVPVRGGSPPTVIIDT